MKVLGVNIVQIGAGYYYADGPDANKPANVYKCASCGKWADPIFKGVPGEVESYVYEECSECDEVLCKKCAEPDEITGAVTCLDCYGAIAMKREG